MNDTGCQLDHHQHLIEGRIRDREYFGRWTQSQLLEKLNQNQKSLLVPQPTGF